MFRTMFIDYIMLNRSLKMNIYILPVQRVLLEYVLKLGDMIFFPWSASEEDIEASSLLEKEKELLKLVLQKNYSFFKEYLILNYS